jgi:phosphate transport system permease protein
MRRYLTQKPILSPAQEQRFGFMLLTAVSVLTVLPIIVVIIYIITQGASAISWTFISSMPSNGMRSGGIFPAIIGTLYLTVGTAIFSVPQGIGAAIYIAE